MLSDMQLGDIVLMVQAFALIGGGFYFTGQVVANLRELREIATDHEQRLRAVEDNHQKR